MREYNFEPILYPLRVIDSVFQSQGGNALGGQAVIDLVKTHTEGFKNIPWLIPETVSFAKNSQLVQMRGLVHDMPGTEPYAERYKVVSSESGVPDNTWCYGRYRDRLEPAHDGVVPNASIAIDDAQTVLNDRHILVVTCGSPGQSEFLRSETAQYAYRQWNYIRENTEAAKPMDNKLATPLTIVVKCYEDISAKLNDVFNFVGILNFEPYFDRQQPSQAEQENFNFDVPWYYREAIPILHVIAAEKIAKSRDVLRPFVITDDIPFKFNMDIRNRLLDALTCALSGDRLAAEFLLCHLISSIYGRSGAIVLGNLSLNICGVVPESEGNSSVVDRTCDLFHKMLANVCYKSIYVSVRICVACEVEVVRISIAELNKVPSEGGADLLPKFVPAETRLKRGRLQLPRGSQIVIDETKLEAGKLDEQGVKVLTALEDISQFQRMYYDFVYYQKEFDAEYNVVVISDFKSLVKCSLTIPLSPAPFTLPSFEPVDFFQMAVFLAGVRDAVNDFELPADIQEVIANDFAALRKEMGGTNFTAEDLSTLIVLARWLTISFGLRALNEEIWSKAKAMEHERRSRLANFSKRQNERSN